MTDTFLRLPDVMARTALSRRTIYRRMGEGTFPQSIKIGPNAIAWRESELAAWMEQPVGWGVAA
jgi:prophage regulatory protein